MSRERVIQLLENNDIPMAKGVLMDDLDVGNDEATEIIQNYLKDKDEEWVDIAYKRRQFKLTCEHILELGQKGLINEAMNEIDVLRDYYDEGGILIGVVFRYVYEHDIEKGIELCKEGIEVTEQEIEKRREEDRELMNEYHVHYPNVENTIDRYLETCEQYRIIRYKLCLLAFHKSGENVLDYLVQARTDCMHTLVNGKPNWAVFLGFGVGEKSPVLEIAKKDIKAIEEECNKRFFDIPYKDRKLFCVVKDYPSVEVEHIYVAQKNNLPDIDFGLGGAVTNQLYVGHPYVPGIYLPFEDYQQELVEDKLRELCEVAQCLGATKITIEAINSNTTETVKNAERNIGGGIGYKEVGVSGEQKNDSSTRLLEAISKSINIHQVFTPIRSPFIPDNLIYYPSEPSWQRLYNQRMLGQIVHEIRVETKKNQVVGNTELNEIKGEFKALVLSANGSWSKRTEESFSQQENAILSIKIEFAPLSTFVETNTTITTVLTPSEQEYLEEVKFTLEDGEIGPRERKSLERARIRLGLSEARTAELEASLAPKLTEEEKEYLEEVKAMLEDGEIGQRERKSLERTRIRLGISEERAKELETL